MSWAGLAGDGIELSESAAEGARFGCRIARLVVRRDVERRPETAERVIEMLESAVSDLVICRWSADRADLTAAVLRSSRVLLPADTLVYWACESERLASAPSTSEVEALAPERTAEVLRVVEEIVVDSFVGYGNHYTANPRLDSRSALEGYVEWARDSVARDSPNLLLLRHREQPVGIATLRRDGEDLEVELAGLIGTAQGRGWYRSLLAAVGRHAVMLGCSRVVISTQVPNVRAQRPWARAGFAPLGAVSTFHAMTPGFWGAD